MAEAAISKASRLSCVALAALSAVLALSARIQQWREPVRLTPWKQSGARSSGKSFLLVGSGATRWRRAANQSGVRLAYRMNRVLGDLSRRCACARWQVSRQLGTPRVAAESAPSSGAAVPLSRLRSAGVRRRVGGGLFVPSEARPWPSLAGAREGRRSRAWPRS